ncbi:MAG TPA: DUF3995 domain-containing protein [Micrococcales bacterium]|uniref:DUF3995 domain-containing protein n=1 Tax=Miniimonas TaxID=947525 RepID=UPI000D528B14|nr:MULTISPECIES: DUF3995 domain-containing protein [Miniimonas]HCX84950.1 DUF3995 domain-containing protein [Micrococcales bacterium]
MSALPVASSGRRWLVLAAACGLVHAAFSAYWAFGGTWLAETVGQWALDWYRAAPTTAMVALLAIALLKATVAVGPLINESHPLPGYRWWRALCWLGGTVLLLYGLANMVGAWLAMAGVVDSPAASDRAALIGHAALWDPLFALWGGFLLAGLVATRAARRRPGAP